MCFYNVIARMKKNEAVVNSEWNYKRKEFIVCGDIQCIGFNSDMTNRIKNIENRIDV